MWYMNVLWGLLGIVSALLLYDVVRFAVYIIRRKRKLRAEAEARIDANRERLARKKQEEEERKAAGDDPARQEEEKMTAEHEALLLQKMEKVEEFFEKYGAVPQDINQRNRERFGQRRAFLYRGNYYRVDHAEFDDIPFLLIDCIDDPKYASVGVMEDVEAIPVTLSDEKLEKEVRYALEIEPYPENYPDW